MTSPHRHAAPQHSAARTGGGWGAVLRETGIILVSAIVLSLVIKTFFAQAFYIPSGSMENTLLVGDRVMVTKLAPGPLSVNRGDIVVFKDPGGWLDPVTPAPQTPAQQVISSTLTFIGLLPQDSGEHLIKRVIGVAGDHVECCDEQGRLMINGVSVDEPYIAEGSVPSQVEFDVVVPEGSVWVMGDNRGNSEDSRFHQGNPGGGSVPVDDIVGVAFVTVWPADRLGLLRNPGTTFEAVPSAGS